MTKFFRYFVIALLGQIVGIGLLIFFIEVTGSEILWTLFLMVFVWPSAALFRGFGAVGDTDITLAALVLVILYSLVLAALMAFRRKLHSNVHVSL
jgi:hypothetical protein